MDKRVLAELKYNIKRLIYIPTAIILCIRFPFLYPRNRFSGLHYNNWKLSNYISSIYKKYHVSIFEENSYEKYSHRCYLVENIVPKYKHIWFLKKITESGWCEFWTNPFATIYWKCLKFLYKYPIQLVHCLPTYTELDAMPEGWKKAFGIQLCKDIKKELIKSNLLYKYRIAQIKEKWGELCWYDCGGTKNINKIINKYSYISKFTCIKCGELATGYTPIEYWKSPYCDKCKPENSKYFIDFGLSYFDENNKNVTSESWYGWTGNINGNSKEEYDNKVALFKEYLNSKV